MDRKFSDKETADFEKSGMIFRCSIPMACPYLPDRFETQLFSFLDGQGGQEDFDRLSHLGFRRSQNMIYKPACSSCDACVSVRVRVKDFVPTASFRRIARRNGDLGGDFQDVAAKDEFYQLFYDYIQSRHGEGQMAQMSFDDYEAMLGDSPVESRLFTLYSNQGQLVGCCAVDFLHDGLSAIYSFFAPSMPKRSLGYYIILQLIERARLLNKDYVYLGYWVAGSPKMDYKKRFLPLEGYIDGCWRELSSHKNAGGAERAHLCRLKAKEE